MTKFTEGEWVAANRGPHWNNKSIDCWTIHWSEDGECVVDHVYSEHDAYLMAASKEMYAALTKCLNFIANTESELGIQLGSGIDARAALAKARGEA